MPGRPSSLRRGTTTEYDSDSSSSFRSSSSDYSEKDKESQGSVQEPSTARLVVVLIGLWAGVLLVALDSTMLATITAPVSSTFNSFTHLSWIGATFSIGSSISQPLSGQLTDIFGRRAGLVVCYLLFLLGTLLCGLSPYSHSLWVFLAGRVVQGLGGGSLCSITSFIESDLVPLGKRAIIEGIGNVAFGATLALGGLYGGAIDVNIGWKWAFLIQVPVIAFNALLVLLVVPVPKAPAAATKAWTRVDYMGCVLILLAIVFFQYGMNDGSISSWASPLVIVSMVVAGVSFIGFLYWDSVRAANPLIPIRYLLERTIASSQISFFFNSASSAVTIFYVPIYLQVLGASTQDSGIRFIPYAIAFGLGSFATGYAVKKLNRYYNTNLVIQASCIAGTTCLCTMTRAAPAWAPYLYLFLLGLGYGGAYVTRLMGLLSSADPEKQAVIQAASWTISSTGFTIGIGVAAAIFQRLSLNALASKLKDDPELFRTLQRSFDILNTLSGDIKDDIISIYVVAVRGVFFFALGTILVSAVASFMMRNNTLETCLEEKRDDSNSAVNCSERSDCQ